MKKALISITLGIAAIMLMDISYANAGKYLVKGKQKYNNIVTDTIPLGKNDSTKWKKKKYPDSTRPKLDTLRRNPTSL